MKNNMICNNMICNTILGKIADLKLLRQYNYEVNQILANSEKVYTDNHNNDSGNNSGIKNHNDIDSSGCWHSCISNWGRSYMDRLRDISSNVYIVQCSQYLSYASILIDSIYFDIIMDTIMLLPGITILSFTSTQDAMSVFIVYIIIGMIEFFLKIIAKGTFRYYRNYRNFVDGLLILPLFIIIIIQFSVFNQTVDHDGTLTSISKILVLLRILCYPRNILVTKFFTEFRSHHQLAIAYAFKGAGHFRFMLLVLMLFIYIFACVGLQLFGGSIIKVGYRGISKMIVIIVV